MPDWFYRTVAKRALFALPDATGRAVALGVIGALGRSAAGGAVIDFMGHMAPDSRLTVTVAGVDFASPMALGWRVDPGLRATRGLARFGVGAIEILADAEARVIRGEHESLVSGRAEPGSKTVSDSISPPILRRQNDRLLLPNGVSLPVIPWLQPPASMNDDSYQQGVVLQVGGPVDGEGWSVPAGMPADLPMKIQAWREFLPRGAALIVSGGVADPRDAVALRRSGADLIFVEAGLVFRGPGLIKRCNEALLTLLPYTVSASSAPVENVFRRAAIWAGILGASLAAGGLMTLLLAYSRVVLPYDEHYLGLTAEALRRNSPKLFAFMAHDRGILAGTMLGLGWIYGVLAFHGIRRGVHGAKTAVAASALTGFASFFAFFGFGYFDTLHAFVAAILAQMTVQILVGADGGAPPYKVAVDSEDSAWRRAQWGQLLWLVHAAGLIFAGCMILGIGMTSVFVAEDLDFLCLTGEQARMLGDRMIAVVAHDRATLGGMLLSSGVAMLLPILWCQRRGAHWLWLGIAGLGLPAYAAAFLAHFMTGYVDWRHLLPAAAGAVLWAGGLVLTSKYLGDCQNAPSDQDAAKPLTFPAPSSDAARGAS